MKRAAPVQLLPSVLSVVSVLSVQAAVYEVGPGRPLATPNDVPWESLNAGDTVRIHWRKEPYRNKWVICRQGTKEKPIVVEGVSGPNGEQPIIDGENATTRKQLNYWNENKSVIKIGGANKPPDTLPKHIWIRNLEVRNGRQPFTYTGRNGLTRYQKHSSGILIEKAEHVRISHCTIQNNANGIQSVWFSKYLRVDHCHIHSNGVENSGYEHNVYIDGMGALFEYNHFGPPRAGCPGVNVKSRASQTIVRYNWIEGGKRCINIAEARHPPNNADPGYRDTFIYGNVVIRDDKAANNNVLIFGGDMGETKWYRKGTLHFFNNTVIANRTRSTSIFHIATDEEFIDCRNNIILRPPGSGPMALLTNGGRIRLSNNWVSEDVRTHFSGRPQIEQGPGAVRGTDPGIHDLDANDFRLRPDSPCIGAAGPLTKLAAASHADAIEYVLHRQSQTRPNGLADIGAFGFANPPPVQ